MGNPIQFDPATGERIAPAGGIEFDPATGERVEKPKGVLSKAWQWANRPTVGERTMGKFLGTTAEGERQKKLRDEAIAKGDPSKARTAEFWRGVAGSETNIARAFTAPLGIAAMGVGPALRSAPTAVQAVGRIAPSLGFGAQGVKEALTPRKPGEDQPAALERRLMGASQAAFGAAGTAGDLPKASSDIVPKITNKMTQAIRPRAAAVKAKWTANIRLAAPDMAKTLRSSPDVSTGVKGLAEIASDSKINVWNEYDAALQKAFTSGAGTIDWDYVAGKVQDLVTKQMGKWDQSKAARIMDFADQLRQQSGKGTLQEAEGDLQYFNHKADAFYKKPEWAHDDPVQDPAVYKVAATAIRDRLYDTIDKMAQLNPGEARKLKQRYGSLETIQREAARQAVDNEIAAAKDDPTAITTGFKLWGLGKLARGVIFHDPFTIMEGMADIGAAKIIRNRKLTASDQAADVAIKLLRSHP